ncbi:hypothetical protein B566_EDAN016220 [Ephemera danica]|nr:hypothetical protein B566_EDAN016220 [Ephemera danica]
MFLTICYNFGRPAFLPADLVYGAPETVTTSRAEYAASLTERLAAYFNLAREKQLRQHALQRDFHDRKECAEPFRVGAWVCLFTPVVCKGLSPKLMKHWTGPYGVREEFSDLVYVLAEPGRPRIRKVAHFNRLKPATRQLEPIVVQRPSREVTQVHGQHDADPRHGPPGVTNLISIFPIFQYKL